MRVTITDVAKEADVSASTVSRVIHDHPRISEETKNRVRETMERLGYYPNALARGLAKASTGNLGLILPNSKENLFTNPFFIEAMRGIGVEAQARGYNIMFSFSNNPEEEVGFLRNYINSRWVDGIILLTTRENDRCVSYLQEKRFPFVVVGRPDSARSALWVDNDNFQAVYNVTNLLIDRGCRNIAFLGGPGTFSVTRDRLHGFRQALEIRGIHPDDAQIGLGPDFSEAGGQASMEKVLASGVPDAVVTTDDYIAFGAQEALDAAGVGPVAVVGFNNTMRGRYQTPSLTSVDVNPAALGAGAVSLLIDAVTGVEGAADHKIVDTRLIERDSTASHCFCCGGSF
ncbi:MAG: LacI family transcriptional regulator [Spirochaetales bacterium]|nr:LacI family transcriptional regulator [Spirochaetales bacterium]